MSVAVIKEPLPIKKNYMKVVRMRSGSYCKSNHVTNNYVDLLYESFTDHDINAGWLLRTLTDPLSKGIGAELVDVTITDNQVIIQPSSIMCKDPEVFAIEFDRDELICLTRAWRTLAMQKVSPIYIYYKDGKCWVSDVLPDGVE